MSEISGALFDNDTTSHLVKTGVGKVYGVIVNSHTSGTLRLDDGIDGNDETANPATATLTMSGAIAPAVHAQSVLTSDTTNVSDGATVTIGAVVYRFKDTPDTAFDIQIGTDAETSLANLKAGINASGTEGVEYFAGLTAHPYVFATGSTATTLTVVSILHGTASNSLATTETSAHLSWEDTTLGGGTGASVVGVASTNATFTINDRTYTFTTALTENCGGDAIVDEILWVTSNAVALDNMKSAINASGTEGTDYSTGTVVNADVEATTNTDTAQTISALVAGVAGNSITISETLGNTVWGSSTTTLTGGSEATITIMNTYTFPSGSQVLTFPEPINFVTGLYATVGGTLDYTILYN